MVSSINSIRIWSQQAALNAFKDASDNSVGSRSASGGSTASLADMLYPSNGGSDDDGEDTKLTALIASLQQAMHGGTTGQTDEGSVDDMSSKAFMKALRDKLEGLKDKPETAAMATKMLQALDNGTLTVTEVTAGEKITAWDATDTKQAPNKPTSIDKSDWSSFLKEQLTRDESGKFVRNADSSYIEKKTGASSYFGMVGEAYYYLSWTLPVKPGTVTTLGGGTTPTADSSTK